MAVYMRESDDGGKTLHKINEANHHGDNHALWIDSDNTKHTLLGSDGGVAESLDGFTTWQFKANLPTVQFYDAAVDNALPFYNLCGGTQDNYSWCGPSRTKSVNGIVNSDWYVTTGGGGVCSPIESQKPQTSFFKLPNWALVGLDKSTREGNLLPPP